MKGLSNRKAFRLLNMLTADGRVAKHVATSIRTVGEIFKRISEASGLIIFSGINHCFFSWR